MLLVSVLCILSRGGRTLRATSGRPEVHNEINTRNKAPGLNLAEFSWRRVCPKRAPWRRVLSEIRDSESPHTKKKDPHQKKKRTADHHAKEIGCASPGIQGRHSGMEGKWATGMKPGKPRVFFISLNSRELTENTGGSGLARRWS